MNVGQTAKAAVPSIEQISLMLAPFKSDLSQVQLKQIQQYSEMLLHWNRTISLTAVTDPAEIIARHFGESLFAASFLDIGSSRLADVGTGAGFPGLALKIVFPEANIKLFEANLKKCAFLTEVVQRLGLANIEVRRARYEESGEKAEAGGFDFICARALGEYKMLLSWAKRTLNRNGRIVLWLGTDDSVRIGRSKELFWEAPVPIPESRRRVILVGRLAN
jgi:16S rRNA (guanine527-N7)-methyltransferase